jgi:O-antigen ligase
MTADPGSNGSPPPNLVVKAGLAVLFFSIPVSISAMQAGLAIAILGAVWELMRGRKLPRTPIDLPVTLFIALTFFSAAMSGDPENGMRQFAGSWTVAGLYLVVGWARNNLYFRRLMALLFVSATVIAVYGIVQHLTGVDLIRPERALESLEYGGSTVFFPRGAFSHYQTFSNVFFLLFCLSLAQAMLNRSGRERLLWLLVSLVIGTAVLFTYTRGIWLAALGAIVFEAALSGRKRIAAAAAVGGAALLAVALSSAVISSRAKTIVEVEGNVERFLLWEPTWNMIRDYPLLGVGVGNFQRVQAGYVREEVRIPMSRTHSHNNLLQVTAERGLFGLFIFLWIWYVIVKEGFYVLWSLRKERGSPYTLVLGSLAGLLGFFLDGLFQNNFGDTEVVILFWILAGVVIQQSGRVRERRLSHGQGR